ncbi:MAG: VIT domain-containing protein [Planctomycetota bacterium]
MRRFARRFMTSALALALTVTAWPATQQAYADGMLMPVERRVPQIRDAFTVEDHIVTVDIESQNATTRVDQHIKNVSGGLAQAIYMFPVPRNANIADFAMYMGEKRQEGEMMEAAKAREIYEQYVRQLTDPALLEYVGQGIYKTSVFPFQADETKRIQLEYRELLTKDGATIRYLYPLNTEKFSKYALKRCRVEVNITGTMPLRNIYSPTHDITIKRIDDLRAQVVFEVNDQKPTTDFELFYSEDAGEAGTSLITYKAMAEQTGSFVYLVSPGRVDDAEANASGKDLVFVVDVSGSMLENRKLVQVKQALEYCLTHLGPADRFNIVAFSDWIQPFQEKLVENTDANRTEAVAFASRLRGEGGTNIDGAFKTAFASFVDADAKRERMVIFLTDGQPTVGQRDEKAITAAVKTANEKFAARVFNFGVGDDVNSVLLDWVSRGNRGLTEFIRPGEAIDTRIINFYDRIRNPVITDLKLELISAIEGPDGAANHPRILDMQPAMVPDLFNGQQLVITGRYEGQGKCSIKLSGKLKGEEWSRTDNLTFSAATNDTAKTWVQHLWAGRRIGQLLDEIRLNGKSQELVDSIVKLSKRFGIPTPYTSFLVLEQDVPMQDADALRERAERSMAPMTNSGGAGRLGVDGAQFAGDMQRSNRPQAGWGGDDAHAKGVKGADMVAVIGTKTFYRQGNQWVDSSIEKSDEDSETVKLHSDRFFELAKEHSELNQYAARGAVRVKISGKVIDIVAAE